jgi:hypothetical protein
MLASPGEGALSAIGADIDIGVHRSDRRARVGKLNRQGSPQLRWAL